jgi:hypothetical protein
MAARLEEADADMEDKQLEMKELEKLKAEIFNGKYDNPAQEFERQRQALENKYKPKIVLDKNNDQNDDRRGNKDKQSNAEDSDSSGGRFSPGNHRRSNSRDRMDVDELSRNSLLSNSTTPNSPTANQNSSGGAGGIGMGFSLSLNKRRKIDPKSAFNMDDENEEANGPAKKKLVPLGKLKKRF